MIPFSLVKNVCFLAAVLDQLFSTWCCLRLTGFTCFTCCKGKWCCFGFCLVFVFFFGVAFVWFSLCLFFPLLPACLSSFTDWCLVHRQQSREQKKLCEWTCLDDLFLCSCVSVFFLLAELLSVHCAPVSERAKACREAKETRNKQNKKTRQKATQTPKIHKQKTRTPAVFGQPCPRQLDVFVPRYPYDPMM